MAAVEWPTRNAATRSAQEECVEWSGMVVWPVTATVVILG